ncbi:MAG: hypothetical protein ACRCXL_13815 [Dermatophilaceae bacterium]
MMNGSIETSNPRRARHAKAGGVMRWAIRDAALLSVGRGSTHVGRHAAEAMSLPADAGAVPVTVKAA